MQVTRILAVRHGETHWNRDTRIQGHADIDLNARGIWQARRLARALQEEKLSRIYASDLRRAHMTAQMVALLHGQPVITHAGLRERGFGRFEGHTWDELELRYPTETIAWRKRMPDFAPPGGETLLQLRERVLKTVHELASQHLGEQILLVAHGGVLDILYRAATRLDLQAARSWPLDNAAICRLLWSPEGLNMVGWGDVRHLHTEEGVNEADEHDDQDDADANTLDEPSA